MGALDLGVNWHFRNTFRVDVVCGAFLDPLSGAG